MVCLVILKLYYILLMYVLLTVYCCVTYLFMLPLKLSIVINVICHLGPYVAF